MIDTKTEEKVTEGLGIILNELWKQKDKWLIEELLKGLEYVGIEIHIENNGLVPFNSKMQTILKIENKDSKKFYAVGLSQRIDIEMAKEESKNEKENSMC